MDDLEDFKIKKENRKKVLEAEKGREIFNPIVFHEHKETRKRKDKKLNEVVKDAVKS